MIFTLSFGNVAQAKVPAWNLPWEGQGGVSGLTYPILVFPRQGLQNPQHLFKNVPFATFCNGHDESLDHPPCERLFHNNTGKARDAFELCMVVASPNNSQGVSIEEREQVTANLTLSTEQTTIGHYRTTMDYINFTHNHKDTRTEFDTGLHSPFQLSCGQNLSFIPLN